MALKQPIQLTPQQAQWIQSQIQTDPIPYIHNVLGHDLWETQQDIVRAVFKYPKVTVKSCHASGKSFVAADVVHAFMMAFPNEAIIVTTAPTWRQVEKVLWREIRSTYKGARMPLGGQLNLTEWAINEKWMAIGISTNDPDRFNGIHGKYLLVIKDESSGIPQPVHDAIEGVASTGFVRILELGNPTDPTGYFAKTFKSQFYQKITISCFHTPNFATWRVQNSQGTVNIPASIEKFLKSTTDERQAAVTHPYLISPQWVFERAHEWGTDSPMFLARCLGQFPKQGDNNLFSLAHVERAAYRFQELKDQVEAQQGTPGSKPVEWPGGSDFEVIGVDVARFGGDKTVIQYRRGDVYDKPISYEKQDLMQTVGRVYEFWQSHPYAKVYVDVIGLGAGVVDRLLELQVPVVGVNVAIPAQNTALYANLRAELYFQLSQAFMSGDILVPDDEALQNQLTSLQYKYLNGKLIVESKEEMKKRGLKSPDFADAMMLTRYSSQANAFLDFISTQQAR